MYHVTWDRFIMRAVTICKLIYALAYNNCVHKKCNLRLDYMQMCNQVLHMHNNICNFCVCTIMYAAFAYAQLYMQLLHMHNYICIFI